MSKITALIRHIFRPRLTISSEVIDYKIKDFDYEISSDDIVNYNRVTHNPQPILNSDLGQTNPSPLFYTRISWQITESLNDFLSTKIDGRILKSIVHQSEHIQIFKELIAPTQIKVRSSIWSIAPHKKGTKLTIKFDYYSQDELLATEYGTGILFGVKCLDRGAHKGELPSSETINSDPIWEEQLEVSRELPYQYAEKAVIDAPIHTNPKFAKSLGLPDIILQGTCSLAKAINLVCEKELGGEFTAIKTVSAKFTGMIVPPNKMRVCLLKKTDTALYFNVLDHKDKAAIKGGKIEIKNI